MKRKISLWVKKITRYSRRWWYAPLLAALSAIDAYVLFVPNDALVVTAVLARPKDWLKLSVCMTIGSAIGAVSVVALVSYGSDWILSRFVSTDIMHSKAWIDSLKLIRHHGLWGLSIVSLSALPQHAAVIIAGLVRMKLWKVFVAVTIGRGIKYGGFAYLAAKAPDKLRRWHLLPKA